MTRYVHIDRVGPGTCAVVLVNDSGTPIDVCGCWFEGIEPVEDADGWEVCVNCGHDIREVLADELVESVA